MDVFLHISAISRTVKKIERDGRSAIAVIAARTFDTDADDLWMALTNAERIPRWFLPITGDLKRGGRYQLQGNAGGEITKCDAPRHFALTWEYGGDVSWVDVVLSSSTRDSTHLELKHVSHMKPDVMIQYGPGSVGIGWDLSLMGLAEHLLAKPAVIPSEAMAWMATDDGKSFIRQSGDGWRLASIEGGLPEDESNPAAERAIAAYCGEA